MTEQDTAFWAEFPTRLRAARQARGLTMAALADRAGVALDSVFRHEHGTNRPAYPMLHRLCQALDICPTSLFPPLEEWYTPARRGALAGALPLSRRCHDPLCWTALGDM